MKHGPHMVVMTTTKQAEEYLELLKQVKQKVSENDYEAERKKPIKWMECSCCGDGYSGRQWWNQDVGYGVCNNCVTDVGESSRVGAVSNNFGITGVHFLVPQAEIDNPDIIPDRGVPLYDMDARLRIEYDGYVFWKGHEIEHFSGHCLYDSDENKRYAAELIRRCELLEANGSRISTGTVIWKWED